ncbi:unnamed protein product, partial [Prorocentrum cordatum]
MTRRTGSAPAARRSTSRSARRACRARPRSPGRPSRRSQDWRVGKKDLGENVSADWTCRQCQQFNLAADKVCKKCQAQCPPKTAAAVPLGASEFRSGRGSGHFDRQDPKEERNSHNSDDEDVASARSLCVDVGNGTWRFLGTAPPGTSTGASQRAGRAGRCPRACLRAALCSGSAVNSRLRCGLHPAGAGGKRRLPCRGVSG